MIEVKNFEDTRLVHQLEASIKQDETVCRRLKARKITLHTILLGMAGSIYTPNTLHHLIELGLDSQVEIPLKGSTRLPLHANSALCSKTDKPRTSGQCVSFSLIDAGSLAVFVVFVLFSFLRAVTGLSLFIRLLVYEGRAL